MHWQKKDSASTIKDVVIRNTGLSESEFLHPNKDPFIENLEQAVQYIKEAVTQCKHISIMADYDADGVTAAAILYRMFLHGFHYNDLSVRFPKRFSEGYGLSDTVIDEIDNGLLITVDNGISAVSQVQKAKEKGLQVVIIDHHLSDPESGLPNADIIVDPNALPSSEFNGYCGAGLAYKLAEKTGVCSERLLSMLVTLAAIGTIADVVPLVGDNRNLVVDGLKAINEGKGPRGLYALLNVLGITNLSEVDIGFKIGPIINAAGRLYDKGAKVPFILLATERYPNDLPQRLIAVNDKRKELVKTGTEKAEQIIAESKYVGQCPLVIYKKNTFHEGVIGIIAGKLAEKYRVPVIVLGNTKNQEYAKGSGRSFGNYNMKEMLDRVSDRLVSYGGHPGAAGITLRAEDVDAFRIALQEETKKSWKQENSDISFYDLEITSNEISAYINDLAQFAPYGEGNPKIIFKINDYRLTPRNGSFFQTLGNGSTIKLFGNGNSAIGFDLADKYEDLGQPNALTLYGSLGLNKFGRKEEIQVEMLDCEQVISTHKSSLADLLSQRMQQFGK